MSGNEPRGHDVREMIRRSTVAKPLSERCDQIAKVAGFEKQLAGPHDYHAWMKQLSCDRVIFIARPAPFGLRQDKSWIGHHGDPDRPYWQLTFGQATPDRRQAPGPGCHVRADAGRGDGARRRAGDGRGFPRFVPDFRTHSGSNFAARSSATLRSMSRAMKSVKAAGPSNAGTVPTLVNWRRTSSFATVRCSPSASLSRTAGGRPRGPPDAVPAVENEARQAGFRGGRDFGSERTAFGRGDRQHLRCGRRGPAEGPRRRHR